VRNVIVIPGEVVIEKGKDTQKREGRQLYFSQQQARNWVGRGEAEWLGRGEKRIRLTPSGQKRFLEIKATLRLRGRSAVLGEEVALSNEPWARAFEHQQLRPYCPSISNFDRTVQKGRW
jgi:hypothetical protein